MSSGGSRKGAGRKALPYSQKVKAVSIQIHQDTKLLLDAMQGKSYDSKIKQLLKSQ